MRAVTAPQGSSSFALRTTRRRASPGIPASATALRPSRSGPDTGQDRSTTRPPSASTFWSACREIPASNRAAGTLAVESQEENHAAQQKCCTRSPRQRSHSRTRCRFRTGRTKAMKRHLQCEMVQLLGGRYVRSDQDRSLARSPAGFDGLWKAVVLPTFAVVGPGSPRAERLTAKKAVCGGSKVS
jgi:hypothetical protein